MEQQLGAKEVESNWLCWVWKLEAKWWNRLCWERQLGAEEVESNRLCSEWKLKAEVGDSAVLGAAARS